MTVSLGGRTLPRGGRRRAVLVGVGAWITATVFGGLCYEFWIALDVASRQNRLNDAIGRTLEGVGVAENVAHVVVPHALFLPVLYGVPTGLAILALRWILARSRWSGREDDGYS